MTYRTGRIKYVPGTYTKKRQVASKLAQHYISDWSTTRTRIKAKPKEALIPPTICFSRKIGVGALEIADILAANISYRVVDREIIEHIAKQANLSQKTVEYFDERYPGIRNEFAAFLFGEKSFILSDYSRTLFNVVFSIAGLSPTIFVGRGTHLILPRDRVLAVRFVSSREFRIKRLAEILQASTNAAEKELERVDKEQRTFFKKVLGKKDASHYEFDLIINRDYIRKPEWAARIVQKAFEEKFAAEL